MKDINTHPNSFNAYALFANNGYSQGFENKLLVGDLMVENENLLGSENEKFVFYNYDYKNEIENLNTKNFSPLKFPQRCFFEAKEEINFNSLDEFISQTNYTCPNLKIIAKTSKKEYLENVKKLKDHIQKGNIYEINYCITFEAFDVKINPIEIYSRLNSISKAPYSAFVKLNDKYIISSSPELFLSKRGKNLITKPIKGTAPRSENTNEDLQIKNILQNSLKERSENVMIVDVARNDLSHIASRGSVNVNELYKIESYNQVHQMVSTISCEVKENILLDDIIKATFPMASMTGAPKIRAMQLVDDFETQNRGPYSGCIGYLKPNGDFDLSVLIRSIFYNETERYLSFSVGSAITHLCEAEKEYEECLLKAKALMEVLGTSGSGFGVRS